MRAQALPRHASKHTAGKVRASQNVRQVASAGVAARTHVSSKPQKQLYSRGTMAYKCVEQTHGTRERSMNVCV